MSAKQLKCKCGYYSVVYIIIGTLLAYSLYLCSNCNNWAWGYLNTFIENTIGLIQPVWPFSAIVISVMVIATFKNAIISKIEEMTGHESTILGKNTFDRQTADESAKLSNSLGDLPGAAEQHGEAIGENHRFFVPCVGIYQDSEQGLRSDLARSYDHLTADSKVELLLQAYAYHRAIVFFDKTYNTLFGSQILLLKRIIANENKALPEKEVEAFFTVTKKTFEVFRKERWDLARYLHYMIHQGLIRYHDDKYAITEVGEQFLEFLTMMSLSENGKTL